MAWARVWAVSMVLLAAFARGQEPADLSKDPRLQGTIDVHLKRVTLPELMRYLKLHSSQRFMVAADLEQLMVCVYAKHQPLWKVMSDVADVFGGRWKDVQTGWRLDMTKEARSALEQYVINEASTLEEDLWLRADALAKLVKTRQWSENLQEPDPKHKDPMDETPEEWAARVFKNGAYYAAGVLFAKTRIYNDEDDSWDTYGTAYLVTPNPVSYTLANAPTEAIAATNQRGTFDAGGGAVVGLHTAIRNFLWWGTMQAQLVGGSGGPIERPPTILRYPRPDSRLEKTPGGKWLLGWETSLEDSDDPALDKPSGELHLAPSPYFGGARGIEDYLEALSESTDLPIVCDGFRVPITGKSSVGGANVRSFLQGLKQTQKCFVKVQDGHVLVRHGGFWDLRIWEPSEDNYRALEAVPLPGLDDYADFACAEGLSTTTNPLHKPTALDMRAWPMFDSEQKPLTKFDPTPLWKNHLVLAAFGQMSEEERVKILSKGVIKVTTDKVSHYSIDSPRSFIGKGVKKQAVDLHEEGTYMSGTADPDNYVNITALFAIFYGGVPIGKEPLLMECFRLPSSYRVLWGDAPDKNPDYVEKYGMLNDMLAHFFSLARTSADLSDVGPRDSRHLTGTFTFFASENPWDGILTTVDIPSKR